MALGQAFRALMDTLHSEISKAHVDAFASELETLETRVAAGAQHVTARAAELVDRDVVPVVQAVTGALGSNPTGPQPDPGPAPAPAGPLFSEPAQ